MQINVDNAFDGLALYIRLPAGTTLSSPIMVNGRTVSARSSRLVNAEIHYPVLKQGDHKVLVRFDH